MDQLILLINELQQFTNKYNVTDLKLPQIVVVGSQSSGKSSVMERIIGYDILPKASKVATRCPIILQLTYDGECEEPKAIFTDNQIPSIGSEEISRQIQDKTNKIGKLGVTEKPIIFQLRSKTVPTLTLIDLPGIIKNDGELPPGSKEKIQDLSKQFASSENSIILAISSANVDLANSDAVCIAKEYDPEGKRTLNVITKIDLMDKGTTVTDILDHVLLKKSLGTICVVNRSQEKVTKKLSISDTNEAEKSYLDSKSNDIKGKHGVGYLIERLVKKLEDEIMRNIPKIQSFISDLINCLTSELSEETSKDKVYTISKKLSSFITEYTKLIEGNRDTYGDELMGGSKISQVLYEEFDTEIKTLKISKWNEKKALLLLKNTAGNKKMSYSIESAFVCLIRKEIDQFLDPSVRCNDKIRNLLKEFVREVNKEFKIDQYLNLSTRIEKEMYGFIDRKHSFSKDIINNIIRGEKEDIFCLRPNTNMFESLANKLYLKFDEAKNKLLGDIIDQVMSVAGLMLPPPLRMLLMVAKGSGCLNILKESLLQVSSEATLTTLPQVLLDIVNKATNDSGEIKTITDFIYEEKALPNIIGELMDKFEKSENMERPDMNPNVLVLEDMVKEYFEEVRTNIIRNVPKWIQIVFVNDLLADIEFNLHCIRQESNVDFLLNIDPEEAERIKKKQDELQELKSILEKLLRRR